MTALKPSNSGELKPTPTYSNERTEIDTIRDTLNMSNLSDFAKEGILKAIEQATKAAEVRGRLDERKYIFATSEAEELRIAQLKAQLPKGEADE